MNSETQPLSRRVVALPETRQLDVLAGLLERHGATVLRCPLIAIRDAPDAAPVHAWLERLIERRFDLFVVFTGEGVHRLLGFAERADRREPFVAALAATRKLTRGPKPVRALRELGVGAELPAAAPTTDGVIETLETLDLHWRVVAVQLYGSEPNDKLVQYLKGRGAHVECVAPYEYVSAADDEKALDLVRRMRDGDVDAIAFTSKAQFERLHRLAGRREMDADLRAGLARTKVAAIGPVVADDLRAAGVRVDVMPSRSFSMKPLVNELARLW